MLPSLFYEEWEFEFVLVIFPLNSELRGVALQEACIGDPDSEGMRESGVGGHGYGQRQSTSATPDKVSVLCMPLVLQCL